MVAGGASGLGLLIAGFYGMRGVSVAVLDIKKEEEVGEGFQELPSVEYYQCDVGSREEVEAVAGSITKDVCIVPQFALFHNSLEEELLEPIVYLLYYFEERSFN